MGSGMKKAMATPGLVCDQNFRTRSAYKLRTQEPIPKNPERGLTLQDINAAFAGEPVVCGYDVVEVVHQNCRAEQKGQA